jgi:hypothetical protein
MGDGKKMADEYVDKLHQELFEIQQLFADYQQTQSQKAKAIAKAKLLIAAIKSGNPDAIAEAIDSSLDEGKSIAARLSSGLNLEDIMHPHEYESLLEEDMSRGSNIDYDDVPEIVRTISGGLVSNVGPGYDHDSYDFTHEDKTSQELYKEFQEVLKETYTRHNLASTTPMYIRFYGYKSSIDDEEEDHEEAAFSESELGSYSRLKKWLRNSIGQDPKTPMESEVPRGSHEFMIITKIEIYFRRTSAGCGNDVAKNGVSPSCSHKSNLCGAISLILQYYKLLASASQCASLGIQEPTKQEKKEWSLMSDHKAALNPNSKASLFRHEKALELHKEAGFFDFQKVDHEGMATMTEILTERLGIECGLTIFRENCTREYCSHEGNENSVKHWFNVMVNNARDHYQAIDTRTLMSFMGSGLPWCQICKECRSHNHVCKKACKKCNGKVNHCNDNKSEEEDKKCDTCKKTFPNEECYKAHFKGAKCGVYVTCINCNKSLKKEKLEEHRCNTISCCNCQGKHVQHRCGEIARCNCDGKQVPKWPKHQCYIQRKKHKGIHPVNDRGVAKILYADIETMQHQDHVKKGKIVKGVKKHVPNLICTQEADGKEWSNYYSMSDWLDEVMQKEWYGYTIVFHNASGFDSQAVGECLVEKGISMSPELAGGSKIRELKIFPVKGDKKKKNAIRIIDSFMFLCMPLTRFTETFNLKQDGKDVKKGEYCHMLNTDDNNWVKKLKEIPLEKFCYDSMHIDKQKEFMKWYKENAEYEWDNAKELALYCKADVTLLRLGCEEFRRIIIELTTIKPDADGFFQLPGSEKHNINEAEWNQFDFAGTGCDPFMYSTVAAVAKAIFYAYHLPEESVAVLPAKLVKRLSPAARGGRVDLHHMYWKAKKGQRGYYIDFTSLYPYVNFFGRYPVGHPINEYTKELDTKEKCHNYLLQTPGLGVCWVDVKCPQNLRHPVLPMVKDGKLMFDLMDRQYKKFADLQDKDFESREDYFDALKVGYKKASPLTNLELIEAIKQGYEITKIHEICWWDQECIGIFADYVRSFFKIKSEADGLPKPIRAYGDKLPRENMTPKELEDYKTKMTDEELDAFKAKFMKKMGIDLDISKMTYEKNEGLRSVAKIFLNSLWGKMGERLAYGKCEILYSDKDGENESFQKMIKLENKGVKPHYFIGTECAVVRTLPVEPFDMSFIADKNISLAIFTTAQARLKLLTEFLQPLDDRVLYYDTDSCIFYCKEGEQPQDFIPELGTMLGMPTSETGIKERYGLKEVKKDGKKQYDANGYQILEEYYIVEFFSGGPKNYGYKMNNGDTNFKCKGQQTKRADVAKILAYENARDAVISRGEIMVNMPNCIQRNGLFCLTSKKLEKVYRETWTKGDIDEYIYDEAGELQMITTKPWNNASSAKYKWLINHLSEEPEETTIKRKEIMKKIKPLDKESKEADELTETINQLRKNNERPLNIKKAMAKDKFKKNAIQESKIIDNDLQEQIAEEKFKLKRINDVIMKSDIAATSKEEKVKENKKRFRELVIDLKTKSDEIREECGLAKKHCAGAL